jgi:hypothetical protein
MMVERREAEAAAFPEEQKQAALAGRVRALARQTSLTEAEAAAAAVNFASARPEEFGEFIRAGAGSGSGEIRRRLRFLSEPWVLQVTLVLYLFAVLLAFMIGMLYNPALTMIVSVVTLVIMFLWPGWGVTLSIAVIAAALISVL